MRIGDILRHEGLVDEAALGAALAEQVIAGTRLCTLLVIRGTIDADQAARALARQHDVSAALMKHLDNRDRGLASLLPAAVAREHAALPIGRLRDGELVVCVRDPMPHTQAALEQAVRGPVLVTVACAHVLEPLLAAAYPDEAAPVDLAEGTQRQAGDEYDVDMTLTGPIPTSFATELPQFALADLDDAGVDKQFTLHTPRTPTLPPLNTTRTVHKK